MNPLSFERGESALLVTTIPGGGTSTEEVRVKEMAGARNAAIVTKQGNDRIVSVKQLRKLNLKIVPPANFAPTPAPPDPKEIFVVLRAARQSRNLTLEFMAQLLRVEASELATFEAGRVLPSDDTCLRLADVLSLPLDPIVQALEHSRVKEAKRNAEIAEANRLAAEKKAEADRAAAEARAQEERRARSFEAFTERLMDVVPVPVALQARKKWFVLARSLFEVNEDAARA